MARAAKILTPKFVIIENVTGVQWDEGEIVNSTSAALRASGYKVAGAVLDLRRVGVPQRRRRFVLFASNLVGLDPSEVLLELAASMPGHPDRTVKWAIYDLLSMKSQTTFDTASAISRENARRIDLLFKRKLYDLPNRYRPRCHRDGRHSYVSMYGRLQWNESSQTMTTGFGSMGQGRYVHPRRPRTLTIEVALMAA